MRLLNQDEFGFVACFVLRASCVYLEFCRFGLSDSTLKCEVTLCVAWDVKFYLLNTRHTLSISASDCSQGSFAERKSMGTHIEPSPSPSLPLLLLLPFPSIPSLSSPSLSFFLPFPSPPFRSRPPYCA